LLKEAEEKGVGDCLQKGSRRAEALTWGAAGGTSVVPKGFKGIFEPEPYSQVPGCQTSRSDSYSRIRLSSV